MNEDEIENRFQEIRNELNAYKEQLDSFKEDLKILLKHRSIAPRDIVDTAKQFGNRAFDQSDVRKCLGYCRGGSCATSRTQLAPRNRHVVRAPFRPCR